MWINVIGGAPQGAPAPLPFRIDLEDGSSRTDLASQLAEGHLTVADLRGWGWLPVTEVRPPHDPATQHLVLFSAEVREAEGDVLLTYAAEDIPPPTAADLIAYASQRRWEIETGGTMVAGALIRTDEKSQGKISGAVMLLDKDPTLEEIDFEAQPEVWVTLDRPTMEDIGVAVGRHVQACFSACRNIHRAIRSDPPTITTPTEIDAAFVAAGLVPPA